ncbi:hypothetical protein SDC9_76959 [bioreactor metagenome]|uniref:Uncharacterized protein n=1 Tax=bioreactor metagenome TaxID=1076179 RepID=A0A644YPM5_9ZZZZ
MIFYNKIDARADGLANRLYPGLHHIEIGRAQQAESVLVAIFASVGRKGEKVDLDGVVALRHSLAGLARVILGGKLGHHVVSPAELQLAGIGAQPVAPLSAQELIDRRAVVFSLDVPKGDVDGADSGEDHRTAVLPPEGAAIQLVPDDFMIQRIHAYDELGKVLHHAVARDLRLPVGKGRLAVSIDALVGVDPADNGSPVSVLQPCFEVKYVHLGNFHIA